MITLLKDTPDAFSLYSNTVFSVSQALREAQRRCEELEEALNSRSQVLEMLQQEVSSADQQKQVQILLVWMPFL